MNQERTCTTHLARARVQAAVPSCDRAEYPHSGVTSPRSISSISTDRSDFSRGQFLCRLLCSAAVRAPYGDAPEQRRNGGTHHRGIEPDDAEEHPREHKTTARYGNPRNQDQFAAAFNLGTDIFDALLKAHNLVMWVAPLVIIQVQCSGRISARLDLPRSYGQSPNNCGAP